MNILPSYFPELCARNSWGFLDEDFRGVRNEVKLNELSLKDFDMSVLVIANSLVPE